MLCVAEYVDSISVSVSYNSSVASVSSFSSKLFMNAGLRIAEKPASIEPAAMPAAAPAASAAAPAAPVAASAAAPATADKDSIALGTSFCSCDSSDGGSADASPSNSAGETKVERLEFISGDNGREDPTDDENAPGSPDIDSSALEADSGSSGFSTSKANWSFPVEADRGRSLPSNGTDGSGLCPSTASKSGAHSSSSDFEATPSLKSSALGSLGVGGKA